MRPFADEASLDDLLCDFERLAIPHEAWTHREHLGVAACYVWADSASAMDRMWSGIKALNSHMGVQDTPTGGYHETVTRAWISLVSLLAGSCASRFELACQACELFSDKHFLLRFYSQDRIMSPEARAGWVEPDLAPFEV